MCVVLRFFVFAYVVVIVCSRRNIFDETADNLLKDLIGDIDIERQKWTTPKIEKLKEHLDKIPLAKKLTKTTVRRRENKTTKSPYKNFTEEDIKKSIRIRDLMHILNDNTSPIPSFERGDDDPAMMTRRFEEVQKESLRDREWRLRMSNLWRNKTIMIMDHFVHATRYKLPYSQMLRKKYYNVTRYRIGFLFGLLHHLKRQQMYLYDTLETFRIKIYAYHMHLRIYEKTVRLDVDIKDAIRMVKVLESHRRVEQDPKYYDEYYEDEMTTTKPVFGVEQVIVTAYTMPKANVKNKKAELDNITQNDEPE